MADPDVVSLTANHVFRQNYKLWIKGKHLTCDVMKKYIRTKKNDFQPALKKMFEWLLWEIKYHPCTCSNCIELKLFLKKILNVFSILSGSFQLYVCISKGFETITPG